MSFEEEDDPALRPNPYTQVVGKASNNKRFQQSPMLRVDHEDPGLHYIGESLPKPGNSEATWAGRETHVGISPIPARADHSHDTFLNYTACGETTAGQVCAAGQSLLAQDFLNGDNYLVSGSLFSLPKSGIWFISTVLKVDRSGGGIFTGQINILFFYLNGAFGRGNYRVDMTNIATPHYISVQDFVYYGDTQIGVEATVEVAYQHSDSTTHVVTVGTMTIVRLAEI